MEIISFGVRFIFLGPLFLFPLLPVEDVIAFLADNDLSAWSGWMDVSRSHCQRTAANESKFKLFANTTISIEASVL